jgi:hypothetical protein
MEPRDLADSEDLRRGPSSDEICLQIAISLERQMKQLSEYLGEARIGNVRLLPDRLELSIDLDFYKPLPSGQEGDWLATSEDVKAFRSGFKKYLRTESKTSKLSNLFFAEYLAFIRSYMKIYGFGKNVVRQLPKTAERRLAGRPRYTPSRPEKKSLRNEIGDIRSKIREMRKLINRQNAKFSPSEDDVTKAEIREHYPRERFLWMKFFFGSFKKLPELRPDSMGRHHNKKLSKPASWSATDLALLIVQEQHYRTKGIELPILTLRELIPKRKTRTP